MIKCIRSGMTRRKKKRKWLKYMYVYAWRRKKCRTEERKHMNLT